MQNRVPTKPNRALIRPEDGGSAFYATITRADEPTQVGDPLNKATLLQDDTAALFGMDDNAVPNDLFKAIGQNFINGYPQIGDLRYSVLNGIDEKWLLCNGELIRKKDYPDLYGVLPGTGAKSYIGSATDVFGESSSSSPSLYWRLVCGGEYMVAYGTDTNINSFYVTKNIADGWTKVTLPFTYDIESLTICYDDGLWVAFAMEYADVGDTLYVYPYTANDPLGTWTPHTRLEAESEAPSRFEYKNGTFVCININGSTYYSYATKDLDAGWVKKTFVGGLDPTLEEGHMDLCYADGTWVLVSRKYNSSSRGGLHVNTISDPTDSEQSWTELTPAANSLSSSGRRFIEHVGEYWVVTDGKNFLVSSDLVSWTNPGYQLGATAYNPMAVYNDEVLACATTNALYITTDPTKGWTTLTPATGMACPAFDEDGNIWVVREGLFGSSVSGVGVYTEAAKPLPTIDVDSGHAYIKAK